MGSAPLLVLCTSCPAPFLPSPGTLSHLSLLPRCGPPALRTAAGLPGHQAHPSPVPHIQLHGQLHVLRRTVLSMSSKENMVL